MPSGRAAQKVSIPNTVGSSMAFRFSGRARKRTAMSPRRSALSERGSSMSKPPVDLVTGSSQLPIPARFGDISRKTGQARSHNLVDGEPHRELFTRPGSERQNPVEPSQARLGGLEPHDRAEIIARRFDVLAAGERGDDLGCAMAQPVAAHENARAVIGFDPIAGRKIGDAVRPHDLPIGTGQNSSFQPCTLDPATENVITRRSP